MMRTSESIIVDAYGDPSVMQMRTVPLPDPGPGQVRLRHTFMGVNFHDIYCRSGQYKTLALPGTPGIEAAGIVEAAGDGVTRWNPGDRVAYVTGGYGVYASHRNIDAALLEPIPAGIDDAQAASALLRGLTVDMLLNCVVHARAGQVLLVQAASGGMGQLLAQWAARIGATVIGTVRREDQIAAAQANGCHHVVLQKQEVAKEVMRLTGGRGVDVAYDGVGQATIDASLSSLDFCAHLVNYGQSSGPASPIAPGALAARSSSFSRPIVFHYLRDAAVRSAMTARVFTALAEGWLHVQAPREFALADAPASHILIEKEGASAPILLVP